jgi:DNA (cytosine-5)-methyltransferase 1
MDALWDCVPASAVGAPHRRDRIWILGYARAGRCGGESRRGARAVAPHRHIELEEGVNPHPTRDAERPRFGIVDGCQRARGSADGADGEEVAAVVSDANKGRREPSDSRERGLSVIDASSADAGDADRSPTDPYTAPSASRRAAGESSWWVSEPDVGRVANGVACRVDRLSALGDGQVPAVVVRAWRELRANL